MLRAQDWCKGPVREGEPNPRGGSGAEVDNDAVFDPLFHTKVGASVQEGEKQSVEHPRTSWEFIPSTFLLYSVFRILVKLF